MFIAFFVCIQQTDLFNIKCRLNVSFIVGLTIVINDNNVKQS